MRLKPKDRIIDMDIFSYEEDPYCLIISSAGHGKRVKTSEFNPRSRRAGGLIAAKFKKPLKESTTIVACRICNAADEVMLITKNGTVVKMGVDDIPAQSRTATGVVVQRLDENDFVAAVTIVSPI